MRVSHISDRPRDAWRRRYTPARLQQRSNPFVIGSHDWRHVIGKDGWQRREVTRDVSHHTGKLPDCCLGAGHAVEVAHGLPRMSVLRFQIAAMASILGHAEESKTVRRTC